MTENRNQINPELKNAFIGYLDNLLIHRLRVLCRLTILLVPLSAAMDWIIYPEFVGLFLYTRIVCAMMAGIILFILRTPYASSHCHGLSIAWFFITLTHVLAMVLFSDGLFSPYYSALNLIVLAACMMLPWKLREALIVTFSSMIGYGIVCLGNEMFVRPGIQGQEWFPVLFNNVFIQFLNNTLCVTAIYFTYRSRYHEYALQFELDQKKQELEISYDKLEKLDSAKSRFFANISHELRTPLTLIISPLQGLRSLITKDSDSRTAETLDLMYGNCLRLLALINDLLDLVRLEDGKLDLKFEAVDLHILLPGLVNSVKSVADRSDIDLAVNVKEKSPLYVNGDKDRLGKIFLNLLFNAIKFTPKGGNILVSTSRLDETALIEIKDTGIGIAEEKLELIFNRFWQETTDSNGEKKGTGIGLSLVKELIDLHRGQVKVKSQKGQGTTFSVELPLSRTLKPSARQDKKEDHWLSELYQEAQYFQGHTLNAESLTSQVGEGKKYKDSLLIVEDEPDMMRFLAQELDEHYCIFKATDGEMGVEMALKHNPQLILTDLMLPKVDGITLCRRLKASPSLLPNKIILLTARAEDQAKISALQAGADDFLSKPFSVIELKTRLANLLLNSKLERELQIQNQTLETTLVHLKNAESQLIQTERLSALGNLASGIMHEINNPINFMLTAIHCLKSQLPDSGEDVLETVQDIKEGLERVRDIIVDLKGFAYEGKSGSKTECEPNAIYRIAKRLLGHQIDSSLSIEVDIDSEVSVIGNQNQLVQLLVNLLQNSIFATKDNADLGKNRQLKLKMFSENNEFVMIVRDNGSGITKEDQAKIFDPFFTTKDADEGTGLGLSISHTIVVKHGGTIDVSSKPSEFTEFKIRLPLAERTASDIT